MIMNKKHAAIVMQPAVSFILDIRDRDRDIQ